MIFRLNISASISRLAISLLMLLAAGGVQAQKIFSLQKDSIPLFRGFQVSFDLVGAAQLALSDYGQYEGALRLNLHDQWFPIIEAGIGKAVSLEEGDPLLEKGPWALMPQTSSPYPWRTANDADYDITGRRRPQGDYRSVVWGSERTFLYRPHSSPRNMKPPKGSPSPLISVSASTSLPFIVP